MAKDGTTPRRKKSGAAGILVKLVLISLLVYSGITLYGLQDQIRNAKAEEAQLAGQVEALTNQNAALQADIKAAGDPKKLEEVARDKLGMVKSGEKVFYDTGY